MPTQEERLSTVEQTQVRVEESIKDLNHYVTMLIGIVQREEWEIREMKGNLRSIDDRLTSFEQSVNTRFGTLENRMGALDGRMGALEARMGTLDARVATFEQGVNTKLDQILLSLSALTAKSE